MMDAPWRIELLGWLRAIKGDQVVSRFRTHKTGALLAYLAFYRHRSHPREVLIELLWPGGSPEAGRQSLRKALSSLRLQLEPPDLPAGSVVRADHATVQLNPAAVITDIGQFEAALEAAARAGSAAERRERLAEAADLYGGELLPGYFEEWALQERQRLAEVHLRGLEQLVAGLEQSGELHEALRWARRTVTADPLREEAHYTLIRLLGAAGQAEPALGQYRELERLLAQDLGVAPSDQSRALAAELERGKQAASPQPARKGVPRPGGGGVRQQSEAAPGQAVRPAADAAGSNRGTAPPSLQPTAAGSPPGGRLPLQFTRFFGREAEIAWLCEAVGRRPSAVGGEPSAAAEDSLAVTDSRQPTADGPRLVTLTGPGGSGKTRLASEVARRMRGACDGAVWFVPLADLSEPWLIVDKALDALGLPRSPEGGLLEQLMTALSSRPTLLLLDNFEQLVDGGAELVQILLERVETLTVLVTSRRRLDLAAEREFPVSPLPVPVESLKLRVDSPTKSGRSDLPTLNSQLSILTQFPSVALFVDRAQAVRPDFQVTAANAAAVAGLCARLEGLPLALELAAARIQVLTPAQMLVRLEGRFELLVGRQRDAASRHRSLWAALDWSYQLLPPELQRFFAQLSVFRGGWTLDAAEAVCEEPRGLDFLEELRGCSLVQAEDGEREVRFRLLETLREFGAEHLAPAERAEVVRRHAAYYTALAEQAEADWAGPAQEEWLERLELEHDNLRAVLIWSDESGEVEIGLRLGGALWWFWHVRDHISEGRERMERLLARAGAVRSAVRARAQATAGLHAFWQGDVETSESLSVESLAIGRELGDKLSIAFSLRNMGEAARSRGDMPAARSFYEEGLAAWRELGNRWGVAMSLDMLGDVARAEGDLEAARSLEHQGLVIRQELGDGQGIASALNEIGVLSWLQRDLKTARSLMEEALAIRRELGSRHMIAASLICLGDVAVDGTQYAEGQALFEEAVVIQKQLGNRRGVASTLIRLGRVAVIQDDWAAARPLFEEGLVIGREVGSVGCIAVCVEGLAEVTRMEGRPDRAARLFGAAAALREAPGAPCLTTRHAEIDELLAALRAALGEFAFTAAWEAGQALTAEQAVAEALEESDILP